jgi:hypothetical protein
MGDAHLAKGKASSATEALPCFGQPTGVSELPLMRRATPSEALDLTLASRPFRQREPRRGGVVQRLRE